jgi:electron transport complex protein RnfB
MHFPPDSAYRRLAHKLDALPNRFPPAADESDLRLLACLFTEEEASLAAELQPGFLPARDIALKTNRELKQATALLKEMAHKGLVAFGKTVEGRPGFALLPFVVGIYENQGWRIDAEIARRFEDYFRQAFSGVLQARPAIHRVVVGEAVKNDMTVQPYESATGLVDRMQAWGVIDCICRKQKALIGEGCTHPIDVCMVLGDHPDAFAGSGGVRAMTREEAHATLRRCAEVGLVHCVSNNQQDLWYICNCCTCSCGILRGMAELGIAGVVANSAFLCQVDLERCAGCGECGQICPFKALEVGGVAVVDELRCAGCGVCVLHCPQEALSLARRETVELPPRDEKAWAEARLGRS